MYDAIWVGIWQRGGKPNAPKPIPLRRPGEPAHVERPAGMSVEDMRAALNRHQAQGEKKKRRGRRTDGD